MQTLIILQLELLYMSACTEGVCKKHCSLDCLFLQDFLPFGTDLFQHAKHPFCGEKRVRFCKKSLLGNQTKEMLYYHKGSLELFFCLSNILEIPFLALVLQGLFGLNYSHDPVEIQNTQPYRLQQRQASSDYIFQQSIIGSFKKANSVFNDSYPVCYGTC